MDNIKRALIFLFAVIGLFIFYLVIAVKIEVMVQQTEAKVQLTSASVEWEGYLFQKTLDQMTQRPEEPREESQEEQPEDTATE